MPVELRILSGARAGQTELFDAAVISIGRGKDNRLRFDPKVDLDVSSRHAEIRLGFAGFTIVDLESTNGTFVNGKRVLGEQLLQSGDVISFGLEGPQAEFHDPMGATRTSGSVSTTRGGSGQRGRARSGSLSTIETKTRLPTVERVAIAVREQTRGLRRLLIVGAAIVIAVAISAMWLFRSQAGRSEAVIRDLVRRSELSAREFETRLQGMNDTALTNELRRVNDSLLRVAFEARAAAQNATAERELRRAEGLRLALSQMDLPAVRAANDAAVVLVVSELGGRVYEASGFSVDAAGLVVTNRHVVDDGRQRATKLGVKFANTNTWLRAQIVHVAAGESEDLALLRIDAPGPYPAVASISANGADVPVGSPIATIGFPLGTNIPMARDTARTTLTAGYLSKALPDLLQIDAFAGHGSSGSAVFDAHGHVVGVIWGGPRDAGGRIVYAVPSDRVAALLRR